MQRFTRFNQQRQHGRVAEQRSVIAAELFFIHQHLRQFAEHHAAQDIVDLAQLQPAPYAIGVKQSLEMVIQPYLIGPGLLDEPFYHELYRPHLLMRLLLLEFAARSQLRAVGQQRLLQAKVLQRGDKPHRRNQLVFTHILSAFILRHALLQQAQLERKFRHLGIIQVELFRHGSPAAQG